ncbi:LEPR-XLL domain-containing protein [Marinobacterium stanieri]|nr:LEPR-XLL domain-containing protein [Marinobacterium stanieri]
MLEALEPRLLLNADLGAIAIQDFLDNPDLTSDFATAFEAGFDRLFDTLEEVEGTLDLETNLDIDLPALLDREYDGAGEDGNNDGNFLNDHRAVDLASLMDFTGQLIDAGFDPENDFVGDVADIDMSAFAFYDFNGNDTLEISDVIRSGIDALFSDLNSLVSPTSLVSDLISHLDVGSIAFGDFELNVSAGNLVMDPAADAGEGTYYLTFDVGVDLSRSDTFHFDLGRGADLLGLIYPSDADGVAGMPEVTIDSHFGFETMTGLSVTVDLQDVQVGVDENDDPVYEEHVFVDANNSDFYLGSDTQVRAGVDTSTTVGAFDFQIGFLEISNGAGSTFELTAEAVAEFADPGGGDGITFTELGDVDYVTDNVSVSTDGALNVLLNIDVETIDVASFDDAFDLLDPVIQLSGDPFDAALQSPGSDDPRTAPIISLLDFDALTPFRNMTDEGFLNILRQLETYCSSLENNLDLFGFDLPFVSATSLLDALDFTSDIHALIDDLYDEVPTISGGISGTADVPTFISVQELASDLNSLLPGSLADLVPSYNADTLVLSFDFALAQTVSIDGGFDFSFDLGQVGDVNATGGFTGDSNLGMDFTLGMDLSDPAEVAITSTQALFALYSNFNSGGNAASPSISSDIKFRLKVAGREAVDVELAAGNYTDLDGLATAIQDAIDAVYADGDINVVVDPDTGRLVITVDSYTAEIVTDNNGTEDPGDDTTEFVQVLPSPVTIELLEGDALEFAKLGFNDGQSATTSPLPSNGILSGEAIFDVIIDGTSHQITVAHDGTNTSVSDLLGDMEGAINTAFGATVVSVEPLNVVDNVSTPDDQGFKILASDGSSIRIEGINAVAQKELGLTNGSSAAEVSVGADSDVLEGSGVAETGQLTGDAGFTIEATDSGGITTATAVTILSADTGDNASLYDLVEDINAELPAGVVAGLESGRLVFSAVDADTIRSIRITNVSGTAQTELGLENDMAASKREESLAFVSDASFGATIELDASGTGSLNAGFLGLDFGNVDGGLSASISGSFETRALAGVGDITDIESLLGSLGDMDAVANVDVSGDVDLALEGLSISGAGGVLDDLQTYLGGLASPAIDILVGDITGFSDGITLEAQADSIPVGTDYADPDLIVNLKGLEELKHFGDFAFADVLDVFQQARSFLEQLVDIDFLGEQLPLVGLNLADALDFVGGMVDIIDDMIDSDAATVQELVGTLNAALEQVTDGLISMTYEVNSPGILGFDIDFSRAANVFLPVNIALSDLLGAGFEDFANLAGSANIGADFAAGLGLSFGVDVSSITSGDPLIYIFPDETGINVSGGGSASEVSFLASIGPLGASIEGGSLDLDVALGIGIPELDLVDLEVGSLLSDVGGLLDTITADGDLFNLDFDFDAVLPVFGQLGGSSVFLGNLDFLAELDNLVDGLQFTVDNLPNFDLIDFDDLGLLDTIQVFVEGFDMVLGTIGDLFSGELFGISGIDDIPFLGDILDAADDFVEDIRSAVVQPLLDLIDGTPEFLADVFEQLQELIYNAFDAIGALPNTINDAGDILIEFLDDAGDTLGTWTDVDDWPDPDDAWQQLNDWISSADGFEFALDLGGEYELGFGDVDLGLPVLGLEIDDELTAAFAWSLFLGMGVNLNEGFYFKFAPDDGEEIALDLSVSLPDEVQANLGFLTATATNYNVGDYKDFFARFAADLDDGNGDGKLTFSEIPNADLDVGFGARVDLDLGLSLGFSDEIDIGLDTLGSLFPSIGTDLSLQWGFGSQDIFSDIVDFATALPENAAVVIDNITLNVGSFLSDVLSPVVDIIQTIVGPFDPLLDILTSPIPVISDLAGQDISLLDIAAQFGYLNQGLVDALTFITDLYDTVSGLDLNNGDLIVDIGDILGIGPIEFGGDVAGAVDLSDANTANTFQDQGEGFGSILTSLGDGGLSGLGTTLLGSGSISGSVMSQAGTSGGAFGGMSNNGLIFPFLEDPTQLIGLLFGRDMTLISFDLAPLEFGFEYSQFFSIWGPIGVTIGGGISALIDFAFGYDTYGIRTFADNGFSNPLDLMAGFYIYDDTPQLPGVDVPEIVLSGQITAALAINIGIAEAGVGGGIFATAAANLNDPNDDMKVRPAEIWSYLYDEAAGEFTWENVICIFDYSVLIEAKLFVYVEALWGLWEKSWEFGPSLPLLDLEYSCEPDPLLATDIGDGTLRLNMGEYASERIHGPTDDVAEDFSVYLSGDNVMVEATIGGESWTKNYGSQSKYTHIMGHAGLGDDTIDLSGMTGSSYLTSDLTGGTGNDTLIGGGGEDVIYGETGIDTLLGGGNNDFIDGGSGDDKISGGLGNDILHGRLDDDIILGDGGNDIITGEQGEDIISAGSGDDRVWGGQDIDWIAGGEDNDTLQGDQGDDLIWGDFDFDIDGDFNVAMNGLVPALINSSNTGDDWISGGGGSDWISGDKGNDLIWGDSFFATEEDGQTIVTETASFGTRPTLDLTAFNTAGHDVISGGAGNDRIWGEDGNDVIRGDRDGSITDPDRFDMGAGSATGDDWLYGGRGSDAMFGNDGNDHLYGGSAGDYLFGNDGDDVIEGAAGRDAIFGDDGEVEIFEAGDPILPGGTYTASTFDPKTLRTINAASSSGNDEIDGGVDDDFIFGGSGLDDITGAGGEDLIFGDNGEALFEYHEDIGISLFTELHSLDHDHGGRDEIEGFLGADIIIGGSDGDVINGDADGELQSNDIIAGDHADVYRQLDVDNLRAVLATMNTVDIDGPGVNGNDLIAGGGGDDIVFAGPGDDQVTGSEGQDVIVGDNGELSFVDDDDIDTLDFVRTLNFDLTGDDWISGGAAADIVIGGGGEDHLYGDDIFTLNEGGDPTGFASIDDADAGADILIGDQGEVLLTLGLIREVRSTDTDNLDGDNDVIRGNQHDDVIIGGVNGNPEPDQLFGDEGDDILIGDEGEVIYSADYDDPENPVRVLVRSTEFSLGHDDEIHGNDGEDLVLGGAGDDWIQGDNENNTVAAAPASDILFGDQGRVDYVLGLVDSITATDALDGDGGDDTIEGNDGRDFIVGGVGDDHLSGEGETQGSVFGLGHYDDIILGDLGVIHYNGPTEDDGDPLTIDEVRTISPSLGGEDSIFGNSGSDIVFGGADNDEIHGDVFANSGNWQSTIAGSQDWLLGDNGQLLMENEMPLVLESTDTDTGGNDVIHGDDGDDLAMGGIGDDTLYGETQLDKLDLMTGAAGNDSLLGDNGRVDWVMASDSVEGRSELGTFDLDGETPDKATLDRIMTIAPTDGGSDVIFGNGGHDTLMGGTGGDRLWGDSGDGGDFGGGTGADGADGKDLIFGDHAKVYPSIGASNSTFLNNDFFAIDTAEADLGGNDVMFGNGNDDIMLGQQGDDILFGGLGNDDLIGGHNVEGGIDEQDTLTAADYDFAAGQDLKDWDPTDLDNINDILDAGGGNDSVAGDNAVIIRQDGGSTSPRFQMVGEGGLLYELNRVDVAGTLVDESFSANIAEVDQANPDHGAGRDIRLLDHSDTIEAAAVSDPGASHTFGNDVMTGGADDDEMFGQLGDDIMQGDGYVELGTALGPYVAGMGIDPSFALGVSAWTTGLLSTGQLGLRLVENAATDGDDYMEGNGGNDRMYGGLGQDDMIGGSSSLFGLYNPEDPDGGPELRPDGADLMYGASGDADRLDRNDESEGHRQDADVMLGDNGNIYRMVDGEGNYLQFNYDNYDETDPEIRVRSIDLLDYGYEVGYDADTNTFTLSFDQGVGKGDLMFGEAGDDILRGMHGDDVLFGNAGNDDLYGEHGNDWISGGTGNDGILGDDGLLYTSRNSTDYGESLYGVAALDETNLEISTPGNLQRAVINVDGELKRTADLIAFRTTADASAQQFNDIIFGGWGTDWIHSGDGDDAVSGAEALPFYYEAKDTTFTAVNDLLKEQQQAPSVGGSSTQANPFWYAIAPYNPGDILRFEGNAKPDEFALYDEYFPREQIWIDTSGERVELADLNGDEFQFLLNFDATEGADEVNFEQGLKNDGNDRIFGDLGNDWIVGGTGRDHMYGGRGSDLINMDDDHSTNGGANDDPDAFQAYSDIVYAGSGRDVMILNTGADRSIDWVGEYNSYIVPFSPFGAFHISRSLQPHLQDYLYDLSESDGADQTLPDGGLFVEQKNDDVRTDDPDPARNYEPFGELGMVLQSDYDWNDQTGAPSDPQPGNLQGPREIMRRELFTDESGNGNGGGNGGGQGNNNILAFAELSGSWATGSGAYSVTPETQGAEAISLYYLDADQPEYMEILASVNMEKDRAGWKSNAYIIFDYLDEQNFKFAGLEAGTDKVQIGHRTEWGWAVDTQSNLKLGDGQSYDLTLVMHGTVATLYVDGANPLSHNFAEPINDGYLGVATDGGRASFDDWQIQKLPPVITLEKVDSFDDASNPLGLSSGGFNVSAGLLNGSSGDLATTDFEIQSFAKLVMETVLSGSGEGGLVYDYYSDTQYKFVILDMDSGELKMGHVTDKGTQIDTSIDVKLTGNGDHTLSLNALGGGVSVSVDGTAVTGHVYNSLVNDGDMGVLVSSGSLGFDSLTLATDDPAYLNGENQVADKPAADPVGADQMLTEDQLALMIDAGKLRWAEMIGDRVDMEGLTIDNFVITDLPGQTLGMALPDGRILIDGTAAGYGWFVDDTPMDDAEFDGTSEVDGMDLLSTVMHEMGHAIGVEGHAGDGEDLMSASLSEGEREVETSLVDDDPATGPSDGQVFEYVLDVAGESSEGSPYAHADGLVDWSSADTSGSSHVPAKAASGSRVSAFPEFLFELDQLADKSANHPLKR